MRGHDVRRGENQLSERVQAEGVGQVSLPLS